MSEESKPPMGKVIDIRDRLPPVVFGDNPAGAVATKILAMLVNDENEPYVHIAALMITSITLQRLLKEGNPPVPEAEMQYIRERAMEMADNVRIEIGFKKGPDGRST